MPSKTKISQLNPRMVCNICDKPIDSENEGYVVFRHYRQHFFCAFDRVGVLPNNSLSRLLQALSDAGCDPKPID